MSTSPETLDTSELFDPVLNTLADISFQAEARGSNLLTALEMLEALFQIGAIPHPDHVGKLEEFARYDPDKKLTVQGQLDEALADYILVWGVRNLQRLRNLRRPKPEPLPNLRGHLGVWDRDSGGIVKLVKLTTHSPKLGFIKPTRRIECLGCPENGQIQSTQHSHIKEGNI
jgi:hypothetical protein